MEVFLKGLEGLPDGLWGWLGRQELVCKEELVFPADMEELVHMRIDGPPMADLLVGIDPELYGPFLAKENSKPVMYVKLVKALYGTLQAAAVFWRNLSGFLIENGFELNPYDDCVANKVINGKQCTVVWHVDDLKISHEEETVTREIV